VIRQAAAAIFPSPLAGEGRERGRNAHPLPPPLPSREREFASW